MLEVGEALPQHSSWEYVQVSSILAIAVDVLEIVRCWWRLGGMEEGGREL
ncbi:MAG: hypothetical protein NZ925_01215 [Sulfolobales archaeon]|nr:hypothetical protein [Sulfolobales archaeon]MCX8208420.1 hypothetical protein [Sulfolobales archaeon]